METLKSILKRLNNKGTIVSLAALIVSLLCQFGLEIDIITLIARNIYPLHLNPPYLLIYHLYLVYKLL